MAQAAIFVRSYIVVVSLVGIAAREGPARASITLSGVDGLRGDVLYLREDLLWRYVGDRDVVVFAFGARELRPYPSPPPQWLLDARRQQTDAWRAVVTDLRPKPSARAKKSGTKKRATTAGSKKKAPKSGTAKPKKRGDGAAKA